MQNRTIMKSSDHFDIDEVIRLNLAGLSINGDNIESFFELAYNRFVIKYSELSENDKNEILLTGQLKGESQAEIAEVLTKETYIEFQLRRTERQLPQAKNPRNIQKLNLWQEYLQRILNNAPVQKESIANMIIHPKKREIAQVINGHCKNYKGTQLKILLSVLKELKLLDTSIKEGSFFRICSLELEGDNGSSSMFYKAHFQTHLHWDEYSEIKEMIGNLIEG